MKNIKINPNNKLLSNPLKVFRNTIIGTMVLATPLLTSCTKNTEDIKPTSYVVNIDDIKDSNDSISLFNVGNYEVKGKSDLKDIKKANKKGVPCGIIINTIASNKAEIYNDVEYVKYIIEKSNIYCPVYLNIDDLANNDMLRVDEMLVLISSFSSKLSENKILVGICGTEANINKLIENDESNILKAYDIFLLNNDEVINVESSVSSMIKIDGENNYRTYEDVENICAKSNLNNSSNFLYDRIHEVKEDETLADIAFTYGLSVHDLLEYNDCSDKEIPRFLRIPSLTQKTNSNNFEKKTDGNYIFGFDISACQSNVNWDKVSEECDFLILKATWHTNIADRFEEFSTECSYRDIPYGVYCANYVSSLNVKGLKKTNEEMKKAQIEQIEVVLKAISNKNITLPIYLDFEDFDGNCSYASEYTDEQCVSMLDTWSNLISKAGYTPGVYCNKTHLVKLKNAYDNVYGTGSFELKFSLWISGNIIKDHGYDSKINSKEAYNVFKATDELTFNINNLDVDMIQPWQYATGFGASDNNGYVDVNFAKLDSLLSNHEEDSVESLNYDEEILKTKEPKQNCYLMYKLGLDVNRNLIYGFGIGFGTCGTIVIANKLLNKIEERKKVKKRIRRVK